MATIQVTEQIIQLVVADDPGAVLLVAQAAAVALVEVGIPGPPGPASLETATYLAGADLGGHRAVRLNSDGRAVYCDTASAGDELAYAGVSTQAAVTGAQVVVRKYGLLTEPSWSWTPGAALFVGLAGALTEIPPASPGSIFSLSVGVALRPDTLYLAPGIPVLL
jgi:hypothetical protein